MAFGFKSIRKRSGNLAYIISMSGVTFLIFDKNTTDLEVFVIDNIRVLKFVLLRKVKTD